MHSKMAFINVFTVVSLLFFTLFIFGLHNFLTNREENGCEMTYMFEYPQFVRIALPKNVTVEFPQYGLYAYGEGHLTEKLREMRFDGIPLLFIPGNAGSFKQVRSLASVSLRKTLNSHYHYHFDYFTLDLNEEYSGLYGGVLQQQTRFLNECIQRILRLYYVKRPFNYKQQTPAGSPPTSVILIGHSLGGVIAKGLFEIDNFDERSINLIITLATPHLQPVVSLDPYADWYYRKILDYWNEFRETRLRHVTLVSIGGGDNDLIVRTDLTYSKHADFNVLTSSIPGVWLSCDHLCIVWCKQLILVLVRSLFDIVDSSTKQIFTSPEIRKNIFRYHLVQKTAGKHFMNAYHPKEVSFDVTGQWYENILRQFTVFDGAGVKHLKHVMVRLFDDYKEDKLAVEAINVNQKDWVFACSANTVFQNSRVCERGINLSNRSIILPSAYHKRKLLYLHLSQLKKKAFSHVIFKIEPTHEMVQLNIDSHSYTERRKVVTLPKWISFPQKYVIADIPENIIHYDLSFSGFEKAWQVYDITVITKCKRDRHHAVFTVIVPWNRQHSFFQITESTSNTFNLHIQANKPASYKAADNVRLRMVLDPVCKYSIVAQSNFLGSLGQLFRFNVTMLISYIAAVLLLALHAQMLSLSNNKCCVMYNSALNSGSKPYYILPIVKVLSYVLGSPLVARFLPPSFPQPELLLLQENGLDFFLLPFFLYVVAFAICYLIGWIFLGAVIFSGQTAHKLALRFLARSVTSYVSEWIMDAFSRIPAIVAAFLIALSYSTCGSLSLCVGAAFYFIKLFKMYEDYLENIVKYSIKFLLKRKISSNRKSTSGIVSASERFSCFKPKMEPTIKESASEMSQDSITEAASDEQIIDTKRMITSKESLEDGSSERIIPLSKAEDEEKISRAATDDDDDDNTMSGIHFHFTCLLLWVVITLVNIPSVLIWAHNYRYNSKLDPDPSFAMSVTLCLCAAVLWQGKTPNPDLKYYKFVSQCLYWIAVIVLMYSPIHLHRIGYLLSLGIFAVTCHQLMGIMKSTDEELSSTERKMKLEPPLSMTS